ncbi:Putative teichuronic acid biosynthesis glycosyltransferase TuaC [Gimesia fumaroli]|uniref:Teichuronic acid biosynthesis glycosyltransferase TuaC n=2 Tax=Gimesia fumaroli TaxID=2527976 RepID=A0A518IDS3_9PLAN|nr:Putative teichuronic acid biosynthesis glycosyltransferase TuaC [Gimesia fumaroli]
MKILFLSNVFPNSLYPGKGTFNCSMIQALSELHPTHVVSPVSWLDESSHLTKSNTSLNRNWSPIENTTRLSVEYPRFYYTPKILHQHYGQFLYWSIKKALQQAITRFQPDIILSYWLHPDGEVAVKAARDHGLPVVVMTGGSDILLLTKNRHRRRAIINVLQQADGVITVSDDIMSAVKNMKIHPQKIHTVYRGVNRCLFTPGDQQSARQRLGLPLDRKIIVSVGRLEPVKGHTVLLDACLKISKQGIPFTCYVLGDGSLEATLLQKANEYGLEGQFQLNGSQQQSRLADWYRAADVIALPSLSEGIPNVLLEAISCGKQFVASQVGGIPEIADPICDQLVSPNDPEDLAEAIGSMLGAPNQNEQRSFEPISWQESAVQISQILSDCSTRFSSGLTDKQKTRSSYRRKKRRIRQQS